MNLKDLNDVDLEQLHADIEGELESRRSKWREAGDFDAILRANLQEEGIEDGHPWREPSDALHAYPKFWGVACEKGDRWESLVSGNLQPPSEKGGWVRTPEPGTIAVDRTLQE